MAENAFARYDQLLNAMGEANADKDARLAQIHGTKASIDSTGKILGETKLALTGLNVQKTIGKKLVKPWLKKKFQEYKNKKSQSGGGDNEGGQNERPNENTQNSNAEEGGQDAPPAYEEDGNATTSSATAESEDRLAEMEAEDAQDTVARGASRAQEFEERVQNGEAEGRELTSEARGGSQLAAERGAEGMDTLEDWDNSNATGYSQARTTFSDEDLGKPGSNVYDRNNGMSADEQSQVNDYLNRNPPSEVPKGQPPSEAESEASRAGQGKGSLEPDEIDPLESSIPGSSGGIDAEALAAQAAKKAAVKATEKTVEKTVAKTAAEEGGEEAGLGVLDVIPGADIFGAIGGAILAAVEAHRQKKEQAEMAAPPAAPTVSMDVGVGGAEAN